MKKGATFRCLGHSLFQVSWVISWVPSTAIFGFDLSLNLILEKEGFTPTGP